MYHLLQKYEHHQFALQFYLLPILPVERLLVSVEEQEKIANFIALIEEKISLQEFRLKQANKFKKALLQQMFV
jgi:type I restriction enzyme S subunit